MGKGKKLEQGWTQMNTDEKHFICAYLRSSVFQMEQEEAVKLS